MQFRLRSGLALHYTSHGAGRVLALLHPVGIDGRFWSPIVHALAAEFRVIAIDQRGHGGSDVPSEGFTLDDLAADIVEFLQVLGGSKPVVAGCSLGAMVALGVALQAPELLGGLVLADGAATLAPDARRVAAQRAKEARRGMPLVVEATLTRWFTSEFRSRESGTVDRIRKILLAADPIVHAWSWDAIGALDYAPRLAEIDAPALVVSGSEDVSTPPAASRAIAAGIRRARYVELAGAAHMAPIEQVESFVTLVRHFATESVRD